jgi:hypothetical protein
VDASSHHVRQNIANAIDGAEPATRTVRARAVKTSDRGAITKKSGRRSPAIALKADAKKNIASVSKTALNVENSVGA